MDCGPAALCCLLEGYGIQANYERVRAACQTSVDGTSIDSLEDLVVELGVDVVQHVVPFDLVPEVLAEHAPSILVVRHQSLHFVVVWKVVGPWIQIMDPIGGRRFVTFPELRRELGEARVTLSHETWRAWWPTSSYRTAFERRLAQTVSRRTFDAVLEEIGEAPIDIEAVSAACHALKITTSGLTGVGFVSADARERLFLRAYQQAKDGKSPLPALSQIQTDGTNTTISGAVFLAPQNPASPRCAPAEVRLGTANVITETSGAVSRWRVINELGQLLDPSSRRQIVLLLLASVALSATAIVEVLVYRIAVDVPNTFRTFFGRIEIAASILAFFLVVLLLEVAFAVSTAAVGRLLELKLRALTSWSLPRIEDDFVRSRPTTDLASRSHGLIHIGGVVLLATGGLRGAAQFFFLLVAFVILDWHLLPIVAGASLLAMAIPIAFKSRIASLDMREFTHSARLGAIFLDALLGVRPVRLHGYQDIFRAQQLAELSAWERTAKAGLSTGVVLESTRATLSIVLMATLLHVHWRSNHDPRTFVIMAFWAAQLPGAIQQAISFVQQYPAAENAAARLFEMARYVSKNRADEGSTEHSKPTSATTALASPEKRSAGVELSLRNVTVIANGQRLLDDITLDIPRGQHVAIVGRSGAGKSSLIATILGFHRPATGRLLVDGESIETSELANLRQKMAWVDPAIHIWNRKLIDNLEYASRGFRPRLLLDVLERADLLSMLAGMRNGLDTTLGPGGCFASGGEGQRIRIGRAMMRSGVELALLDEAFRGLERDVRLRLLENCRELWAGATMIHVSHDLSHTLELDRVLVMENGRIVEDGDPRMLSQQPSRFHELLVAEQASREELWGAGHWRRLSIENGALIERED